MKNERMYDCIYLHAFSPYSSSTRCAFWSQLDYAAVPGNPLGGSLALYLLGRCVDYGNMCSFFRKKYQKQSGVLLPGPLSRYIITRIYTRPQVSVVMSVLCV